jgi:hypothetical protein
MFGIVKSVFNYVLGWIFRGVIVKFSILSAVYYVIVWIANEVFSVLDISPLTNLESTINTVPASLLYFLGVFRLDVGLPMILSAMLVGFIIRRLPIIG